MNFRKHGWLALLLCLPLVTVAAQDYKIHISTVRRDVKANWLKLPQSADCTVEWELYQGAPDAWEPVPTSELDKFELRCFAKAHPDTPFGCQTTEGHSAAIASVPANQPHGFVVSGFKGDRVVALSDTAWVTIGRISATQGERSWSWHRYFLPGWWFMSLVGHDDYYNAATRAGKVAFDLIGTFFIAGVIIWLFYCIRNLRLGIIFPLESGRRRWRFAYEAFYDQNKSRHFEQAVVEKWHGVIEKSNESIDTRLRRYKPLTDENLTMANADHWQETGSSQVEGIKRTIEESNLNRFPTVRIIHAGLEKHELGGYHWLTASEKVDRAIESRAASELENLRRRSLMDWLWNLGTLSPLIGLFGTATGISNAFKNLVSLKANVSQADLVRQLAGGINEALWTTIFGLAVSFFLMMLYFYYHNKLNWIYSKWEDLYVRVSEKL